MSGKDRLPTAVGLYKCEDCGEEFKSGELIRFDDLWEIATVLEQRRKSHAQTFHDCDGETFGVGNIVDFVFRDPHGILEKLQKLVNPSAK